MYEIYSIETSEENRMCDCVRCVTSKSKMCSLKQNH